MKLAQPNNLSKVTKALLETAILGGGTSRTALESKAAMAKVVLLWLLFLLPAIFNNK